MEIKKVKEIRVIGCNVQILEEIYTINNGALEGDVQKNHSRIISPLDSLSDESDEVKAICKVVHTPEVIEVYKKSFDAHV